VIGPEELVLLDTNVLLHLFRGSALGQKIEADYGLAKRPERPLISVVTVGEIQAIARRKGYSAEKRATLRPSARSRARWWSTLVPGSCSQGMARGSGHGSRRRCGS